MKHFPKVDYCIACLSLSFTHFYIMHTRGSGPSSNTEASVRANGKRKTPGGNNSASRNKSTGKKGKASSSGIPDLEINEETMSFYKAMQAKLNAEKRAAAASQDEGELFSITVTCYDSETFIAIRQRNKALMEEEGDEDDINLEEESPPPKRIRTETLVLDEDEAEIASGLRPLPETSRHATQLEKDKTTIEDAESAGAESESNVEGNGGVGGAVDDYSGGGGTGFENNGACF